ncbi:P-loop containing nucleoside triphosphate hydrolase protein [Phlegmacium glaucopus]|nr:P-loop containing nucleoside triphosphate hydrolase protein [Phlegmacium glaucopus]
MATAGGKKASANSNITIEDVRLGVWNLKIGKVAGRNFVQRWEDVKSALPLFYQLCSDIFALAPRLSIFFVFCQIWQGVEGALSMHFSSTLLRRIEEGVITGRPDVTAIISATTATLMCSFFVAYLTWQSDNILNLLKARITGHFQLRLMKASVGIDLPTSQEAASKHDVKASDAWESLATIIRFLTQLLSVASHLALIFNLSRSTGGPFFAIICVIKPIVNTVYARDLWDKVCFGYVDNEDRKRMSALQALIDDGYRQDIISNNLGEWIIKEYGITSKRLGEVSDDHPIILYSRRSSPVFEIISKMLGDLPTVFCAFSALLSPHKFSVASIAILQRSSGTLRSSLESVFQSSEQFRRSISSIKKVYEASMVANNIMNDGTLPYPPIEEKGEINLNGGKGMSFELRDVSFSYPGSQKATDALNKVSMNIKSGQLIVIVGENGSGKSTIIRILSRLYDPTSGQVFIDGYASGDYRVNDLHQATVILSQDTQLYPLSLGENIGLGYAAFSTDKEMIMEAAKDGGALEFMEKLNKGIDTVLDPLTNSFSWNLYRNDTHPLYEEMKKLEKKIDISGGERQRVAAARSFMRFKSGKVNFVAVDEPSSALDAEGELKLFERLIAVREGKTMVFVTHRFGHLTKHADQIICMKDGMVAETGTHEQLMEAKGEYAKLYNIQASAFVDNLLNTDSLPLVTE